MRNILSCLKGGVPDTHSMLLGTAIKSAFIDYNVTTPNDTSVQRGITPLSNTTYRSKQLPFTALSLEDQAAFSEYLLFPALRVLRDRFTRVQPDYVRKLDTLRVFGKEELRQNQKWFRMTLETTDSSGDPINALTIDGRVE